MITTVIKRQVVLVECEVLRRGCRLAAQKCKGRGEYEKARHWNNLAYQGDCLVAKIRG